MKDLWIAVGVLAVLLAAALLNAGYIEHRTGELTTLLEQGEKYVEAENWTAAGGVTREAYQKWDALDTYMHVMLRHSDINEAERSFQEVLQFIGTRDREEYSARNAALLAQLRQLDEMERLSIKNLLSVTCLPAACSART